MLLSGFSKTILRLDYLMKINSSEIHHQFITTLKNEVIRVVDLVLWNKLTKL